MSGTGGAASVRFEALHQFSATLVDLDIIDRSSTERLKPARRSNSRCPSSRTTTFAPHQTCTGKDVYDRRDEALVRLLADTGMFVAEVCASSSPTST